MNTLIALSSVVAAASAGVVAPQLAAGVPVAYAGQQFAPAPYAAGYLPYGYNGAPVAYNQAPVAYNQAPIAYNQAPIAYNTAPVIAAPAPVIPSAVSSQFHAGDEFGNINYGYSNINSAKQEVGNAYGGVTGSYQYIDANGVPQRVDYIADDLGFRVKATNLPVAPAVPTVAGPEPVVYTGVAPSPVDDTDEVKAAKAEFFAAFEEAKSRNTRSVITPYAGAYAGALPYAGAYAGAYSGLPLAYNNVYNGAYNTPFAYNGVYNGAYNTPYATGYGYNTAYNTPLTYATPAAIAAPVVSAPAAREAILTTIKLNPGHATAYRVDK